MPLAAKTDDGERVTATDYTTDHWDSMRGNRKRTETFVCEWCESPMHPKRSERRGTRFFAHNKGSDCPYLSETGGESSAHLAMKGALLHRINRTKGWHGQAEVRTDLSDGGYCIADVVATHERQDRPSWAWEVQLQPQSEGEAHRRTENLSEGHGWVNWVTTQNWSWSTEVPSIQVDKMAEHVIGGLVVGGEYQDEFVPLPTMTTGKSVGLLLSGGFWWVQHVGWVRRDTFAGMPVNPRVLSESDRVVDDYCDRAGALGGGTAPHVQRRPARRHYTADWRDVDWIGHANMARARRHAGLSLDEVDEEALRRWPHEIPLAEIDFYQAPPSQARSEHND